MSIPQTTASAAEPASETATVSAIYVDTENLLPPAGSDDVEFAQSLIAHIVLNWPDVYPPIGLLTLYVPADKSSQWRIWASVLMPETLATSSGDAGIDRWRQPRDGGHSDWLRVRGVQHFSRSGSKNSADMAIVLDAFDDLMLSHRADFVAVLSNDSDFYTLFDKLHEVISGLGHPLHRVPFLWIVAPNGNNLSPEIKRFLPSQFVWDLSGVAEHNLPESPGRDEPNDIPDDILKGIVAAMDNRRQYRASELHDICKELYPSEQVSKQITAAFGMFLKNSTPALSGMGVEVISTSGTSRYVRH